MLCAQDAAIGRIVDLVTEAQVVVCPYDGTVFEKDGACTHIDTCPVRSSPSFWLPFAFASAASIGHCGPLEPRPHACVLLLLLLLCRRSLLHTQSLA